MYARAVHEASGRSGEFVALNCAALPETLIESELFGYSKGAHSAASRDKPGLVEQAEGGTLFLDEIGDMSLSAQAKVLRFLQDRHVLPLGASRSRPVDVRVLAASRWGVRNDVEEDGRAVPGIRVDLAARLGPEPIVLPPLRDRMEDVALLASAFVSQLGAPRRLTSAAWRRLFFYEWPGNIRALEKAVSKAAVLCGDGDLIKAEHFVGLESPAKKPTSQEPVTSDNMKRRSRQETPDRAALEACLSRNGGDVPAVARELGRERTLVWRWIRKHEIDVRRFRGG